MDKIRIEMDIEDYLDLLRDRKRQCVEDFGWSIPECVWNYALEVIEDCGIDPENASPRYVVDNIIVNGDYHHYNDIRNDGETDEELEERLKDDAIAFVGEADDKYVIFSL